MALFGLIRRSEAPATPASPPPPTPPAPASPPPPPPAPANQPAVKARYDAAQPGGTNGRYWANADALGPVAAHSPEVRQRLRDRARYERQNNGYVSGLVKTLAHDLIGSGPRLQLTAEDADPAALRRVERAFAAWCKAVGLTDKLRLMAEAAPVDGEAFAVMAVNDRIRHPVRLDLMLVECDRVAPPGFGVEPDGEIDGIRYDATGNPVAYHVLKQHPGDGFNFRATGEGEWFPADRVVHWFRRDRPDQLRGVSQLAAAMTVTPQMRRLTLASLTAAETAASHAAVLETDLPVTDGTEGEGDGGDGCGGGMKPGQSVPIENGLIVALPRGQKLNQFKAEHPSERYKEFKAELLNEIGRGLNAPFNVVSGNSSGYNYSSSRLDHRLYYGTVWCDRDRCGHVAMDPLFWAWVEFAVRTPGLDGLFDGLPPAGEWTVGWNWDAFASIDPKADAEAAEVRLRIGITTLAGECAAEGLDWRETSQQRAVERTELKRLDLLPDPPAGSPAPAPPPQPKEAAGATA